MDITRHSHHFLFSKEENPRTFVRKGTRVYWMWKGRAVHGKVLAVFKERVQREIKGKTITRNGSPEKPAYLVVSEAGNEALKLCTELKTVSGTLLPWMKN